MRFEGLRAADQAAALRMREVLGQDEVSNAEIDSATAARGRASMAIEALTEAIASTDAEIAAAEEQLAAAADQAQRAEIARQLENQAQAVEEAAKDLERSMGAVSTAFAALTKATSAVVTTGDCLDSLPSSGPSKAVQLLLAAIRAAIPASRQFPGAWTNALTGELVTASVMAARSYEPLRQRAADIRAGVAPAIMPGVPAPPLAKITFPDAEIVLAESIQWHGLDGKVIMAPEGGCTVPVPVAAAAARLGIGHAPESREAALITTALKAGEPVTAGLRRGPATPPDVVRMGSPFRDVGVSLFALAEQERSRLAKKAAA
jgi:hypothetical protein